jgi:hypothetical protein
MAQICILFQAYSLKWLIEFIMAGQNYRPLEG